MPTALVMCTLFFGPRHASVSFAEAATVQDAANSVSTADASEPDRQALVAAGARTIERLSTTGASWTASLIGSDNRRIQVDLVRTPSKRRIILTVRSDNGQPLEIARIIERDDLWYVVEQGSRPAKYRAG